MDTHMKAGGQEHLTFLPSNTRRETMERMHQTYAEMYKVADETMSYLNSML